MTSPMEKLLYPWLLGGILSEFKDLVVYSAGLKYARPSRSTLCSDRVVILELKGRRDESCNESALVTQYISNSLSVPTARAVGIISFRIESWTHTVGNLNTS